MIHPTVQDYQRVPDMLRHPRVRRWVPFRCTELSNGKVDKEPIGWYTSCTNPKTWASFDECLTLFDRWHVGNALGFALGSDYSLMCVDLDGCILPDGSITETAKKYLDRLAPAEPFIERSISGTGIHLLMWYTGKRINPHPEAGVELFTNERFIVMTGVPL